jgi:hypothetical protein
MPNGAMDVSIVTVIKESLIVQILAHVPVTQIVKKAITVINPHAMIPLVHVTNALTTTIVYPPQFVVVMIITMGTRWRRLVKVL